MNFKPTNKIQIRTKLISANMYKTDNDNNNISLKYSYFFKSETEITERKPNC